jgi:hypothetical protein
VSGARAIRFLLANDAALVALVPAARIFAGPIPLKTPLPAIAVARISGTPRNTVSMLEVVRLMTDRVQVTVQAAGWQNADLLLELVRRACPHQRGLLNNVDVDSILPDVVGPDLYDHTTAIHSMSRDFIVKWRTRSAALAKEDGSGLIGLEAGGDISLEQPS